MRDLDAAVAAYNVESRRSHRAAGRAEAALALLDRAEAAEWRADALAVEVRRLKGRVAHLEARLRGADS